MDDGESCSTIYLHIEPLEMYSLFGRWVMSDSFVTPWTVCSPPGFSLHGISSARMLEWVAISFSRGSSWLRGQTLHVLCWQADSLPLGHLGKAKISNTYLLMALQMCVSTTDSSLQPQNEPPLTIIWSFNSFVKISLQMLHKYLKGSQSHVFLKLYPLYFSYFPDYYSLFW